MAHWIWNDVREVDWRQHLTAAGRSTFEQAWAYGEASARLAGFRVERGVALHNDRPVAIVQAAVRRYAGFVQVTQLLRGPLWLEETVPAEERQRLHLGLRQRFADERLAFLYWVPEVDGAAKEILSPLRMRRVMTGYSSIWLDLAPDEESLRRNLDGTWRNMVSGAERHDLTVKIVHGGPDLDRLVNLHDEQRRRRRYRALGADFIRAAIAATKPRSDVVGSIAYQARDMVAGALLFRHGLTATYYVGWTGEIERKTHAQNLAMWRAIVEIKKVGVRWLDLGGIDTVRQPGIARFKLGLGGQPFTLAGSYL
jgi:hypothetical protein